jgi:hypothetical protein
MSQLSASAIIVIAICGAAVSTTILFAFARFWGRAGMDTVGEIRPRGQEQDLYMRAVRKRSHHFAYAESLYSGPSRSSQVYSVGATTPGGMNNPSAGGGGGGGGGGVGGAASQRRPSQQANYYQAGGNQSNNYVNYSNYDGAEGYYEESPYSTSNPNVAGHYHQGYSEQQQQQHALPVSGAAAYQSGPAR